MAVCPDAEKNDAQLPQNYLLSWDKSKKHTEIMLCKIRRPIYLELKEIEINA